MRGWKLSSSHIPVNGRPEVMGEKRVRRLQAQGHLIQFLSGSPLPTLEQSNHIKAVSEEGEGL